MPEIEANGIRLFYIDRGSGPETVVFSHSYVVDHRHFAAQIEALTPRYRVIAYDHRDHGQSQRVSGTYDLDDLTADGIALIEELGVGPCHWVGLSTGGFVGLRLALRRPELLRSLVLASTSAEPEVAVRRLKYRLLLLIVRTLGFGPVMGATTKAMFSSAFVTSAERAAERALWQQRFTDNDPAALTRFAEAIFWRDDVSPRLGEIRVPTLVVHGEDDAALPLARAHAMADGIPGARLAVIPGGGHLCSVDAEPAFTAAVEEFLAGVDAGVAAG